MQYMLLIFEVPNREPATLREAGMVHMKLAAEMREKGVLVSGDGLQSPDTATSVRFSAEGQALHDGPFPETREQLAGYYLIEAPDLDVALSWAKRMPCSPGGGVEVRPVMVY